MPRKQGNQPTGSPIRVGGGHGGQLRIQLHQPDFEVVDRQQVVVRRRPGRPDAATPDHSPSAGAPGSTRDPDSAALGEAAIFDEPVPAPLPIRACVITSPAQVAHRFLGRRRRPHLGQQPRPMQFRQLARVPPVGLDPNSTDRRTTTGLDVPSTSHRPADVQAVQPEALHTRIVDGIDFASF